MPVGGPARRPNGTTPDGFSTILCDTAAPLVHQPETELRIRIAGLGTGAQVGKFLR